MIKKLEGKSEQQQKNEAAAALSQLFGAKVVPQDHFDEVNKEREKLLRETEESEKLQMQLAGYYCKFLSFKNYHSKWKPTTREIEKRTNKLASEKLIINFTGIPQNILENIEEAYKCYINGQEIAAYLMILRTVELTISELYDPSQNPNKDFVTAKKKLEWVNKNFSLGAEYTIMKGYIEGRNEVIHNIHKPTQKQMMAAFETVNNLVGYLIKLKPNR